MAENNKIQDQKNNSFIELMTSNPIVALLYCGVSLFIEIKAAIYNGEGEHLLLGLIATANLLFSFICVHSSINNKALKAFKAKLKTMSTEALESELNKFYRESAMSTTKQMMAIGNRKKMDKAEKGYQKTLAYGEAVREELKSRGKNYMSVKDAGIKGYVLAGSPTPPQETEKESSVIKSAVVGGVVAGPAGAVVGAIHAADKNNRAANSSNNKEG